jgi:hypothetical protein
VDWFLGSWVTVVVNDQQIRAQVVEVPISITSSDGVLVGAVVGDATGFDWQAILAAKQSKTEKRVSALEQNAEKGVAVFPGLTLIKPTSVVFVSGSGSTNTAGKVSMSGCTAVSLNGVFSSKYTSYRLIYHGTPSSSTSLNLRLRSGSTDSTAANGQGVEARDYERSLVYVSHPGVGLFIGNTWGTAAWKTSSTVDLHSPFEAVPSAYSSTGTGARTGAVTATWLNGYHDVSSSFDGVTLLVGAGTFDGHFSVYGYNSLGA